MSYQFIYIHKCVWLILLSNQPTPTTSFTPNNLGCKYIYIKNLLGYFPIASWRKVGRLKAWLETRDKEICFKTGTFRYEASCCYGKGKTIVINSASNISNSSNSKTRKAKGKLGKRYWSRKAQGKPKGSPRKAIV